MYKCVVSTKHDGIFYMAVGEDKKRLLKWGLDKVKKCYPKEDYLVNEAFKVEDLSNESLDVLTYQQNACYKNNVAFGIIKIQICITPVDVVE